MKFLLCYLLILNGVALGVVRADKLRAIANAWRTPERTFRVLAVLGGGLGVLVGFQLFRHKTKHRALMASVLLLTLANAAALALLLFLLTG